MQVKGTSPVGGADKQDARAQDARLKAACAEMEAVFLNLLLSEMRKTVPKSTLTGGGYQEEVCRSLLDSELARNMAKAGGTGLADMLYRQLGPQAANKSNKGQAPD